MTGFCVNCGRKREMIDVKLKRLPNLRKIYEGKCTECDNRVVKKRGN